MGKDKAKDKEHHDGETAATSETNYSPRDTHRDAGQDVQDLSRDCEALNATLAQTIAEAVAREMAKANVHYQAILNERGAAPLQTSLKSIFGSKWF